MCFIPPFGSGLLQELEGFSSGKNGNFGIDKDKQTVERESCSERVNGNKANEKQ